MSNVWCKNKSWGKYRNLVWFVDLKKMLFSRICCGGSESSSSSGRSPFCFLKGIFKTIYNRNHAWTRKFSGEENSPTVVQMFRQNSKSSLSARERSPPDRSALWVAKLQWHSQLWIFFFFSRKRLPIPVCGRGTNTFAALVGINAHSEAQKGTIENNEEGQI